MVRVFCFLFFLFYGLSVHAQSEVFYYKDSENLSLKEIVYKDFELLNENGVLERHSTNAHWFKIPSDPSDSTYIFRVPFERYTDAQAYQGDQQLEKLSNERYLSYRFTREQDVFIRIDPELHDYIPIELHEESKSILKDRYELLLNSFYYGFAFLIIIYNLGYYFVFKDDAFLDYALLLLTVSVGIFTLDGMLNFFGITGMPNKVIMILNYSFLAYFSSKFAKSYLFLDHYYPKTVRFTYLIGIAILVCGLLYLFTLNYYYLLSVNTLLFSLLLMYWLLAVSLFRKNRYTRIFIVAYSILLFSGFDYYFLKFIGYSVINTSTTTLKIGAFVEMIILSGAVLYRMNVLNAENESMRNEILQFSSNIKNQKEFTNKLDSLSLRERQIFNLIAHSYSNKEIANTLNVSINTVKFHVKNIYEKLEIKNRKEALSFAQNLIK